MSLYIFRFLLYIGFFTFLDAVNEYEAIFNQCLQSFHVRSSVKWLQMTITSHKRVWHCVLKLPFATECLFGNSGINAG